MKKKTRDLFEVTCHFYMLCDSERGVKEAIAISEDMDDFIEHHLIIKKTRKKVPADEIWNPS